MGAGYSTVWFLGHLAMLSQTDNLADNWGLLPYRRQIIAVSESRVILIRPNMERGLIFSISRPAGPCSQDGQPDR